MEVAEFNENLGREFAFGKNREWRIGTILRGDHRFGDYDEFGGKWRWEWSFGLSAVPLFPFGGGHSLPPIALGFCGPGQWAIGGSGKEPLLPLY